MRANLVILNRALPLSSDLQRDSDYRLAYEDHLATVIIKQPNARYGCAARGSRAASPTVESAEQRSWFRQRQSIRPDRSE